MFKMDLSVIAMIGIVMLVGIVKKNAIMMIDFALQRREVGLGAEDWEPLVSFYTSAGFSDERVHLFHATGLHEASADSGENERIEIVRWPLGRLDAAIDESRDAKTLIGLLLLARRLDA